MDSKLKIIAGLGNPGENYVKTRHNIGFLAIESLASKFSVSLNKSGFNSLYVKARFKGHDIFFVKPLSYMNKSGFPLQQICSYYKIPLQNLIVIHDDMDLEFQTMKIVKGRGHGGHNGIRSIFEAFGKKECTRIRLGVGRPRSSSQEGDIIRSGSSQSVTGHVLGHFSKDEEKQLDDILELSCNACLHILEKGVHSAMNLFNTKTAS